MKVAVMGAGSIGSLFGGLLAKAGNDVALIGRQNHIRAIQRNGLRIKEDASEQVIKIKSVVTPSHLHEDFDLILLTVKAYDTQKAVTQVKALLKDDSCLLCLQNGLGPEETASEIVGRKRVLRGVTSHGALLQEPGLVIHTGKGETTIGESNGKITERAQNISELFSTAGLSCEVTNNINGTVWSKVLINAGINPFGALTGMKNGELLRIPELRDYMAKTVEEGINVTKEVGTKIGADLVTLLIKTAEMTAENKNSMLQDIEKGKRTEIDYINGAISKQGQKRGVLTPLNTLLTYLVKGLEAKRLVVKSI